MGKFMKSGEPQSENLLTNLPSDAAGSKSSSPIRTTVSPSEDKENDPSSHQKTGDDIQEAVGDGRRRSSAKVVTKGLVKLPSSKRRRPGIIKGHGGAEQKKKLNNSHDIKLVSLNGSSPRRKSSSNHEHFSNLSKDAGALPNYLKATKSSGVRMVSSTPSPHKSKSSISSSGQEGEIFGSFNQNAARKRPAIALRRTAMLRPMRILAKIPSLRPKRHATRRCSEISNVSHSSIHRATCSSAIKDSKFPAQVESEERGDGWKSNPSMKVCPYSYCSLHGHPRAAPLLKRLMSARKRVKSQRIKKLDQEVKGIGIGSSHEAENELAEAWKSGEDTDLHADEKEDGVKEEDEAALQQKQQQSQTASLLMVDEESMRQASDLYLEGQHGLEPSPTFQETCMKRESEGEIVEYIYEGKNVKDECEKGLISGKGKSVSIAVQTEPEHEELGTEPSAADYFAKDTCVEVLEAVLTVQENVCEKGHLTGDLSHEDSTSHNMPLDTSKFVYIGEEEEERGAAIRTEELASVHERVEGNLESLGEPKDTLTDSREVPTLESLGERAGTFSGSSEEPNSNVPCMNNMDKSMESPGESEVDSTSNDSYKSAFGGKKFNGLWYLIYQHMVSDLDENGGMESTVERDNKEERKINAKLSPEFDHNPRVEKVEEEAPQLEGLRQSDAIKLLQEAITKILEKSQDQLLIKKSASNYAIFVKKEVDDLSTDWERREDAELKEKMVEAHLVPKAEDQRGLNAECRPNHLASQRWSNLKKYILMRRFIKAMEKTKNLGRRIHGYPSSEVSPEHEKVNLRQQLVGERRSAEEWMLDYALQKAVSTLDPAQKRRVALLVEAFERVNPIPAGKTLNNMNASSPSTVGPLASRKTSLVETEERTATESVSYHELNIEEMPSPSNKCTKAREKLEPSKECDGSLKEIDKFVAGNASVWSSAAVEVMGTVEEVGEAVAKKEENLHSPLPEKGRPISVTDVGEELQLEKKKYTGLWFLIYKQMASGLAAEQGNESTDSFVSGSRKEEEEEAENEKKSIENDNDSLDALESEQSMLTSQREDTEEMNLGKIEAVKLVQKAIDNILGECEDSSPNNLCSTGNEVPEQESKEENCTSCVETSLPPSTDSTKDPYIHKEHKLQSDPERHWPDGAAQQEERKALQDANKSKLRPMRNWNNLRMVILLRRFVKALETKVSNFNPRGGRHLPPDHDAEPEKVNLKHQDMDERKSAEEYLLDYALSRFQAHPCKEKEGPLTRGGF